MLAGIKAPNAESEYAAPAQQAFEELAFGRPLMAKIQLRERDKLHVSLHDVENPDSVNQVRGFIFLTITALGVSCIVWCYLFFYLPFVLLSRCCFVKVWCDYSRNQSVVCGSWSMSCDLLRKTPRCTGTTFGSTETSPMMRKRMLARVAGLARASQASEDLEFVLGDSY